MKKKGLSLFFLIIIMFTFVSGCLENSDEEEVDNFIFNTLDGGTKQLID